jgi:hypothetical protein
MQLKDRLQVPAKKSVHLTALEGQVRDALDVIAGAPLFNSTAAAYSRSSSYLY